MRFGSATYRYHELSVRYRLKLATWIVHREPGQPSPRLLSSPEAVALVPETMASLYKIVPLTELGAAS